VCVLLDYFMKNESSCLLLPAAGDASTRTEEGDGGEKVCMILHLFPKSCPSFLEDDACRLQRRHNNDGSFFSKQQRGKPNVVVVIYTMNNFPLKIIISSETKETNLHFTESV
jgi:hypothetical protein